jgi:hypothetical protein
VLELPDLSECHLYYSARIDGGAAGGDSRSGTREDLGRSDLVPSSFDQEPDCKGRKAGRREAASRLDLLLENMAKNTMSAVTFRGALVRVSEKAKADEKDGRRRESESRKLLRSPASRWSRGEFPESFPEMFAPVLIIRKSGSRQEDLGSQ